MKNRFFAIFLAFALIVTGILPVASVYADGEPTDPAVVTTEPEPEPDPEPVVTIDKVTGVNATKNFPYMKVTWNALSDIDGYIVHYSLDSTFPADKTKTKEVAASKTSINIAELTDGKVYYVRVCGYKGDVVGEWSSTDSVTVKTTGLDGSIKSLVPTGTYYKNGKAYTGEVYLKTNGDVGTKKTGNPYYFLNGKMKGATKRMWEKGAGNSACKSKTKYLVITDCSKNRTVVYTGTKSGSYYKNWTVYKYWKCTTGADDTPTPKINRYKPSGNKLKFGGYNATRKRKPYLCWYASRFYGSCFYHSVLYWSLSTPLFKDTKPIKIMSGALGVSKSHGCIRLALTNAIWMYNNVKTGTRIITYNDKKFPKF